MVMHHRKLFAVLVAVALATASLHSTSFADWTQFSLPNLSDAFAPTAITALPDGRYVFAMQGAYYRQDAFGAPGFTAYSNVSPGDNADPSFLAVWDATRALAGGGGFGASDLYRFDPSALTSPAFTAQGLSLQNYSGVFRDAASLYVGGGNGSAGNGFGGQKHSISFVDLATATSKVIIDNVSTFSGAFAQDAAGNLYVGNTDNGNVYKFTAAQLSLAITGSALTLADGALVYHSINSLGTMAVDALGRIWTSGFLANGLQVYDPLTGIETTIVPALTNANYMVTAFSVDGQGYVAYANQANPFQSGTAQYYGFMAVPEPATWVLVVAGLGVVAAIRCRRTC
jgi:hypothetical protein